MKARATVLTLALCFLGVAVSFAADAFIGTWKMNEAKSKIGAGSPKLTTVVYEAAGDNVKVTVDGTDGDGKALHDEWTGKYDGKDYPVTGDPNTDTRSYKKVNDHTLAFSNKKGDKVTLSGRVVVSADGKTRTVTTSGTDPTGKKFTSTAIYDKQ
jgi:hypothetical protein